MVDITLFEIHLDEGTMTANAPFSGSSEPDEADSGDTDEDEDGGGFPVAPLIGLLVLAVLLIGAKKLLGSGDIEAIEVDTE